MEYLHTALRAMATKSTHNSMEQISWEWSLLSMW
jgi:hypothetical protein